MDRYRDAHSFAKNQIGMNESTGSTLEMVARQSLTIWCATGFFDFLVYPMWDAFVKHFPALTFCKVSDHIRLCVLWWLISLRLRPRLTDAPYLQERVDVNKRTWLRFGTADGDVSLLFKQPPPLLHAGVSSNASSTPANTRQLSKAPDSPVLTVSSAHLPGRTLGSEGTPRNMSAVTGAPQLAAPPQPRTPVKAPATLQHATPVLAPMTVAGPAVMESLSARRHQDDPSYNSSSHERDRPASSSDVQLRLLDAVSQESRPAVQHGPDAIEVVVIPSVKPASPVPQAVQPGHAAASAHGQVHGPHHHPVIDTSITYHDDEDTDTAAGRSSTAAVYHSQAQGDHAQHQLQHDQQFHHPHHNSELVTDTGNGHRSESIVLSHSVAGYLNVELPPSAADSDADGAGASDRDR